MTVKIIFIFLKEESNIMITWNNLDTLASFKELEKVERVNLVEAMTGESGAERVKNYSVPMAEGLTYNYAAKQVDDKVLAALAKLADEAQLAEKFEALYNGEVINTGEKRLVLHHMTRGQLGEAVEADGATSDLVQCILHLRTGLRRMTHSRWKPNSSVT